MYCAAQHNQMARLQNVNDHFSDTSNLVIDEKTGTTHPNPMYNVGARQARIG